MRPSRPARSLSIACLALASWLAGACASTGPNACRIEVIALEKRQAVSDGIDVGYRVRGYAGGPGRTWLAAKLGPGSYISGAGVEVGPGPFVAVVELELTGDPPGYVAVLEIPGKRCSADI